MDSIMTLATYFVLPWAVFVIGFGFAGACALGGLVCQQVHDRLSDS